MLPHDIVRLPEGLLEVEEVHLMAEGLQNLCHVPNPRAGTGSAGVGRNGRYKKYLAHESPQGSPDPS
jgi:hypothetical protein